MRLIAIVRKRCRNCGVEFLGNESKSFCSAKCRTRFNYLKRKTLSEENPAQKSVKSVTCKKASELRRKRQLAANEKGLTYGQYIALFGIKELN